MHTGAIRSFKDLVVWQKAFDLCLRVYALGRGLPRDERFGLSVELRKTARSVVYNIAEGHRRRSTVEYARFLDIAAGSAAELETQLLLTRAVGYVVEQDMQPLLDLLDEVQRMLTTLIRRLGDVGRERAVARP